MTSMLDWALKANYLSIPASVLTSEASFPCHSGSPQHLYSQPRKLQVHHGPATRGPQKEVSDDWQATIRRRHLAAESLWWCSVVPVLIQHRLCPLLTTVLVTSWSQAEWACPPESRFPHPCTNSCTCMWTLSWRPWSELPHARKKAGALGLRSSQEQGMKDHRS